MADTDTSKVAAEVAEVEFGRFVEAWDLDVEVDEMNEEDRDTFAPLKRRLIRQIMAGRLVVSENGETLTYQLRFPIGDNAELVANLPTGGAILQFDRHKDRHNVAKLNAYMGSMCGVAPALFGAHMKGSDLKVVQAIATLFLAS